MKITLKNKIMKIYSILWIPFLIGLILLFYTVISVQLDRLAIEKLKAHSYNSQIYVMRYLKTFRDDSGTYKRFNDMGEYFSRNMSEMTGLRVQMHLSDGMIVDSYGSEYEFPNTKDLDVARTDKAYTYFTQNGNRYISFSSPIIDISDSGLNYNVGIIRYIYPMKKEDKFLISTIGIISILSLAMIVIHMIFLNRIAGRITNSVKVLNNSALAMQDGDLKQEIMVDSDDEIGELAQSFNAMRERLKEYIDKLDEQSERMQQFYNNVTHQLKTPLTSIIGYSQIIQISNNQDDICESAFIIEEAGEKLLKNIEMILRNARRETIWQPIHISYFDISELAEECIRLLKPRFDKLHINAINNCDVVRVRTGRDKVKEIILTLMDNAIIHSGCNNIEVYCTQEQNRMHLHIKDDGEGISPEEEKLVFEAFYQRSENTGSGNGLGLTICTTLASDIQGELRLIGTEGKGAEFVIIIPNLSL